MQRALSELMLSNGCRRGRLAAPAVVTALLISVAAPALPMANADASSAYRCNDPAFASGALIVKGVSCRAAAKVIKRALARPGCRPSEEDAARGRGCFGTTKVGEWTCKGLFPGEGFDLRCLSGKRRVHGSAGG